MIYILYISYCSYKTDSEKHLVDMKSWFQARGYPNGLVQMEMNEVKFSGEWDKNKTRIKSKRVPLVITIHLLLKGCGIIIRKNLYLFYQKAQRVFTPGSMITFHSARKLSSYLVRAKLYPLERLLVIVSVMVNDMKFVTMLQKHRLKHRNSKYLKNKSSI